MQGCCLMEIPLNLRSIVPGALNLYMAMACIALTDALFAGERGGEGRKDHYNICSLLDKSNSPREGWGHDYDTLSNRNSEPKLKKK